MTTKAVTIGKRVVGDRQPVYIVAEAGINHNGDIDIAKRLIDIASVAGSDAVKFQKRDPAICVPPEQKGVLRDTPWGRMTYLEYRYRVEFGATEYEEIHRHCADRKIDWFASCWDLPSVEFMERFQPVCYKVASASLTEEPLLRAIRSTGRPVILSTGMSTIHQIARAVSLLDPDKLVLTHNTSTYPCPPSELNLRMIETLRREFGCPVGYSGHESGLQTTYAAVALGACLVERHITMDRAMWGSDHAASVEGTGWMRMVRDIRVVESAMGDGVKRVYENELQLLGRLRKSAGAERLAV